MKKKIIYLLPAILCLTSCYWDTEVPVADKTVLTISSEGASIEINEDSYLDVKEASGSVKNIKWATSDESIVKITGTSIEIVEDEEEEYKVSRAALRAVRSGTATISAALKTKVVSCTVVVTDSLEVPVLHISNTSCSVYKDDTFNFTSYVTYHERHYFANEEDNPFVYTFASDDDVNNVAYFEETENGFSVSGLAVGEANYTVSTSLFGMPCSSRINVKVKNNKDFIDIENAKPISGGFEIDLTTINDDYNIDNIIPVCKVYNTDGTSKSETVTLSSQDPTIVEVVGNKLVAKKVGNAIVNVTSASANTTIKVNVIKPTYKATLVEDVIDISTAESSIKTINFADVPVHGEGVNLSINGSVNVLKDITGQNINLDYNALLTLGVSNLGSKRNFVLETTKAYYEFDADIYSMIIDTPAEVNSWQNEADKYNSSDYASGGYFILGKSISMNGVTSPVHWNRSVKEITDGTSAKSGFHGVFDGCGYTIDGYHPTGYGSFITLLASDGIIKNVGFKNIVVKGSETGDTKERCILLCAGSGTVSNVYLGYKQVIFSSSTPSMERCSMFSGLGPVNAGKGSIQKVFVEAPTYNTTNFQGFFDLMGKDDYAKGFYGLGGWHLGRYKLKRDPSDTYSIEYPYQYWGTGSYFGHYQEYDDKDKLITTDKTKNDLIKDTQTMNTIKDLFGYETWEYSSGIPQWISK